MSSPSTARQAPARAPRAGAREPSRARVPRHRRDVPRRHLRRDAPRSRPGRRRRRRRARRRRSNCEVGDDGVARRRRRRHRRDPQPRGHRRGQRGRCQQPRCAAEFVRRQREWADRARRGSLEGRDIGSVVFPDAELKLYLTASPRVRAERRVAEAGGDVDEIEAPIDRARPLRQHPRRQPADRRDGSIVVDTTGLSIDEVLERIERLLERGMTKISTQARRQHACSIASPTRRCASSSRAFCRVWCRMTVEGRENVPADGAVHAGPDPPQHPRHADRVGRHPSPHAVHGCRQVVEEQGVRPAAVGARRLSGQPRHRRPRGAAACIACSKAASRWCCSRRASARADRSCSRCSTVPPTSPSRPACRSCRSASAARSGRCRRAPSIIRPAQVHVVDRQADPAVADRSRRRKAATRRGRGS